MRSALGSVGARLGVFGGLPPHSEPQLCHRQLGENTAYFTGLSGGFNERLV